MVTDDIFEDMPTAIKKQNESFPKCCMKMSVRPSGWTKLGVDCGWVGGLGYRGHCKFGFQFFVTHEHKIEHDLGAHNWETVGVDGLVLGTRKRRRLGF